MSKGVAGAVAGAVLIVALVAAGCGGGGGDTSTASLSKAQYVKQANEICKKSQQRREADVNKVAEETKPGANAGDLPEQKLVEAITPGLVEMIGELADLPAPKGDEEQVEAMIQAYEEPIGELEEDPKSAFSGELFKKADEKAVKYGLESCVL